MNKKRQGTAHLKNKKTFRIIHNDKKWSVAHVQLVPSFARVQHNLNYVSIEISPTLIYLHISINMTTSSSKVSTCEVFYEGMFTVLQSLSISTLTCFTKFEIVDKYRSFFGSNRSYLGSNISYLGGNRSHIGSQLQKLITCRQ